MDNILERYKKQLEIDRQNENYSMPKSNANETLVENEGYEGEEMEQYKKVIDEYRKSDTETLDAYKRYHEVFTDMTEKELDANGHTKIEEVKINVKRAFCPKCGEEIISKLPSMFHPFTGQKIVRYDCGCGARYNLECSYPRLIVTDNEGNEIKCFLD